MFVGYIVKARIEFLSAQDVSSFQKRSYTKAEWKCHNLRSNISAKADYRPWQAEIV